MLRFRNVRSPGGATANSQGRQPLVRGRASMRISPGGATRGPTVPPLRGSNPWAPLRPTRGLRPWLLTVAPPGLKYETRFVPGPTGGSEQPRERAAVEDDVLARDEPRLRAAQ